MRQVGAHPLGSLFKDKRRMSTRFYHMLLIILLLLLSCSCRKSKVDDSANKSSDAEKSLNVNLDSLRFISGPFSTINEMRYENEVESGVAAVLLFHQNKIDSIDLSSAIFTINDSTVFYKEFRTFFVPDDLISKGCIGGGATVWASIAAVCIGKSPILVQNPVIIKRKIILSHEALTCNS